MFIATAAGWTCVKRPREMGHARLQMSPHRLSFCCLKWRLNGFGCGKWKVFSFCDKPLWPRLIVKRQCSRLIAFHKRRASLNLYHHEVSQISSFHPAKLSTATSSSKSHLPRGGGGGGCQYFMQRNKLTKISNSTPTTWSVWQVELIIRYYSYKSPKVCTPYPHGFWLENW